MRAISIIAALVLLAMLSGCAETDAPSSGTPEPLITQLPSTTPTATARPTPTPSAVVYSNIYVNSSYCPVKGVWTQEDEARLLLPIKEIAAMLGAGYELSQDGEMTIVTLYRIIHAAPEPDKESAFVYRVDDAENSAEPGSSMVDGVLYLPSDFFRAAMDVSVTVNDENDVILASIPRSTPAPTDPPVVDFPVIP